jgi:hypothetical protein
MSKEFLEIQIFFKTNFLNKKSLSSSKEVLSKVFKLFSFMLDDYKKQSFAESSLNVP